MVASKDSEVVQGLARALWVMAYADTADNEAYTWSEAPPTASGGEDWMNVAPETPERAFELAFYVLGSFCQLNGEIFSVLAKVLKAADREGSSEAEREFGHYLGMRVLGTGCSWEDSHPTVGLLYPCLEWINSELSDVVIELLKADGIECTNLGE